MRGSTLYYVLKDHLGSASVVTDASGNTVGEDRFYPFGETRFTTGAMNTDRLFTGQREITGLGIYDYGARFYAPKLGRFLSPDTIVPGAANPQNLNRFSYVTNNPLRYVDPTGHRACGDGEVIDCNGTLINPTSNTTGCGGPGQQSCGGNGGSGGGGSGGGGSGGSCIIICDPGDIISATYLNGYSYNDIGGFLSGATTFNLTIPTRPPSPCELTDCVLSGLSILFSGVAGATKYGAPEIAGVAVIADAVVTFVAFVHTVEDYHQGQISEEREWILNGTGVLGLIPIGPFGVFGFAFSVINGMATFSGYPP